MCVCVFIYFSQTHGYTTPFHFWSSADAEYSNQVKFEDTVTNTISMVQHGGGSMMPCAESSQQNCRKDEYKQIESSSSFEENLV